LCKIRADPRFTWFLELEEWCHWPRPTLLHACTGNGNCTLATPCCCCLTLYRTIATVTGFRLGSCLPCWFVHYVVQWVPCLYLTLPSGGPNRGYITHLFPHAACLYCCSMVVVRHADATCHSWWTYVPYCRTVVHGCSRTLPSLPPPAPLRVYSCCLFCTLDFFIVPFDLRWFVNRFLPLLRLFSSCLPAHRHCCYVWRPLVRVVDSITRWATRATAYAQAYGLRHARERARARERDVALERRRSTRAFAVCVRLLILAYAVLSSLHGCWIVVISPRTDWRCLERDFRGFVVPHVTFTLCLLPGAFDYLALSCLQPIWLFCLPAFTLRGWWV